VIERRFPEGRRLPWISSFFFLDLRSLPLDGLGYLLGWPGHIGPSSHALDNLCERHILLKNAEPENVMLKTSILIVSSIAAVLLSSKAYSADLIQGYKEPSHRHTAYVTRSEECTLLRIEYRRPYSPRTEFVNNCYPPLDMTPDASRGSTGTVSTFSTSSYAVQ